MFITSSETWELCTSYSILYKTAACGSADTSEQIFSLSWTLSPLKLKVFVLEEEIHVIPIVNW